LYGVKSIKMYITSLNYNNGRNCLQSQYTVVSADAPTYTKMLSFKSMRQHRTVIATPDFGEYIAGGSQKIMSMNKRGENYVSFYAQNCYF